MQQDGTGSVTAAPAARSGSLRASFAAALLALAPSPLHAQNQREQAERAAVADGVTTAVGVVASGGAVNPALPLLATAMKAFTLHRASSLPETEQPATYAGASAMWAGSAVSNVCITAVLLTGGGFAPACLALGAAWGLKTWNDTEHERRYWERCAILRQFAMRQKIRCVYVPPREQAARTAAARPAAAKRAGTKAVAAKLVARPAPATPLGPPHEVQAP